MFVSIYHTCIKCAGWAPITNFRPPKGDQEKGIRPTNHQTIIFKSLKLILLSGSPFEGPLWGMVKRGFRSKPKGYRTERKRNVYVTRSSVQHGLRALKTDATSNPKYKPCRSRIDRTETCPGVLRRRRVMWELPLSLQP